MSDLDQAQFGAFSSAASVTGTLLEEHTMLMREVTGRAQALLAEADEGRWPQSKIDELLRYLHLEVLRQPGEEEWLLFGGFHAGAEQTAARRREYVEIREAVEELTQASTSGPDVNGMSTGVLATIVRNLVAQFEALIDVRHQAPGDLKDAPSTASLGAQPHEWYALTEGPTIDLDDLAGVQGTRAAMGRLLRLREGELVEFRSGSDLSLRLDRLVGADSGDYGFTYLESGPSRWRVEVIRRRGRAE